jgi:hypothetical protein
LKLDLDFCAFVIDILVSDNDNLKDKDDYIHKSSGDILLVFVAGDTGTGLPGGDSSVSLCAKSKVIERILNMCSLRGTWIWIISLCVLSKTLVDLRGFKLRPHRDS